MSKTITKFESLNILYGECSTTEKKEFVDRLMYDACLEDDFFDLHELKKNLDAAMWSPSTKCIDKIIKNIKLVETQH